MEETDISGKCYKCFRPLKSCYCKYIKSFDCGIKFVILMHPKEAYKQKTGTGRLAHLTLIGSEIIIGVDFTQNERLNSLLTDERYYHVLLYPDKDAWCATDIKLKEELTCKCAPTKNKTLLVIVVDATWFCAKKMVKLSANLQALPKISFKNGYRSKFTFKEQPAPECLSSIESMYYLIEELKIAGIANDVDASPLMDIFMRMVNYQLESEKERIAAGVPNRYHTQPPRD